MSVWLSKMVLARAVLHEPNFPIMYTMVVRYLQTKYIENCDTHLFKRVNLSPSNPGTPSSTLKKLILTPMGDLHVVYKESKQAPKENYTHVEENPARLVLIQTHVFYAEDFSARAPRPGRMIANVIECRQSLVSS